MIFVLLTPVVIVICIPEIRLEKNDNLAQHFIFIALVGYFGLGLQKYHELFKKKKFADKNSLDLFQPF